MTESVAESARVRLPFESGSVCPVTTETAPLALNFLCQLARHKSPQPRVVRVRCVTIHQAYLVPLVGK